MASCIQQLDDKVVGTASSMHLQLENKAVNTAGFMLEWQDKPDDTPASSEWFSAFTHIDILCYLPNSNAGAVVRCLLNAMAELTEHLSKVGAVAHKHSAYSLQLSPP